MMNCQVICSFSSKNTCLEIVNMNATSLNNTNFPYR
ncbi:Uncharacterised protein [Bacteroides heparinolyticus]|uniref:Uncharacterized protein n=1 Tax=Prevotella heparinolytica TaxID=28113 RepID=A0A449I095_9BACE|nr:Uncharacterised protein [Bacteroides heparinolyticus]